MSNDSPLRSWADRYRLSRDAQTERLAVTKIKKVCELKRHPAQTFAQLEDVGFPMHLVLAPLTTHDIRCAIPDLMRRPTRAGVYNAHTEALAQQPDREGSLGIVYRWRGSLMAFHDLDLPDLGDFGIYVKIQEKNYFLERVTSLAARLGHYDLW